MSIDVAKDYLEQFGLRDKVMEFDVSSATVDLAAKAVGVEGARICKTLSFKDPDGCILIQTAGDTRIDNRKFKDKFGFKAKMLKPEEVEFYTNHQIGGVCAFGITRDDVKIYCDVSLKRFETVFPACGSSNSAIELSPEKLFEITHSIEWIDISKLPEEASN